MKIFNFFYKCATLKNFAIQKISFNNKFYFCETILKNKIDPDRYVKEVDKMLNLINDQIETLELDILDNNSLADGVLNITLAKNKNYVINIQRPNLQLWLSSPFSGPQRFEFDLESNTWKNIRNKKELLQILNEEINSILKDNKLGDKKFELKH